MSLNFSRQPEENVEEHKGPTEDKSGRQQKLAIQGFHAVHGKRRHRRVSTSFNALVFRIVL